jgi:hypothetical protein
MDKREEAWGVHDRTLILISCHGVTTLEILTLAQPYHPLMQSERDYDQFWVLLEVPALDLGGHRRYSIDVIRMWSRDTRSGSPKVVS